MWCHSCQVLLCGDDFPGSVIEALDDPTSDMSWERMGEDKEMEENRENTPPPPLLVTNPQGW